MGGKPIEPIRVASKDDLAAFPLAQGGDFLSWFPTFTSLTTVHEVAGPQPLRLSKPQGLAKASREHSSG